MSKVNWVTADSETDPCCCTCDPYFEHDIESGLSGIGQCSGCFTVDGSGDAFDISFTGVNGLFVNPWNVGGFWDAVVVGSGHIDKYDNTICDGDPTASEDFDILLSISCAAGLFLINVAGSVTVGGTTLLFTYFNYGFAPIGVSVPNNLISSMCPDEAGGGPSNVGGYGGFATLFLV